MNEREQIINFLLQACDQKQRTIDELQKQLAQQAVAQQTPKSE